MPEAIDRLVAGARERGLPVQPRQFPEGTRTADEARAATGFAIGGTPPFGRPAPLETFTDPDLSDFDEVWAAAGPPDSVLPLAPVTLIELSGALSAAFTEGS